MTSNHLQPMLYPTTLRHEFSLQRINLHIMPWFSILHWHVRIYIVAHKWPAKKLLSWCPLTLRGIKNRTCSRLIGVLLRRISRRRLFYRRKVGGNCWMAKVGWTPRRSLGIVWERHSPHSRRSMEDILGRFRRRAANNSGLWGTSAIFMIWH